MNLSNNDCPDSNRDEQKLSNDVEKRASKAYMTSPERDLSTRHASVREVWKLAWPIIISQASMSLLALVDMYFMGWIGPEAQAAVGFGGPAIFSILSLFFGLFSGLTTFVSQYFGAKRYADCGKMLYHMLYLAVGIGVLCAVFINPFVEFLLVQTGTNPEIFDSAMAYVSVRMWVCPIMFVAFTLISFLRGIGDMKTPAIVSSLIVLANIPLTYIFAFGLGPIPAFGVAGAAIGTVISQGIEVLMYGCVVFGRKNAPKYMTRKFVQPELCEYKNICRIALPVGVCWAIENWGWMIYGLYITRLPKEQSAANGIVQVFMNAAWMPGLAISIATTTLVGQYMGAGNVKSAMKSANYAILMAMGCLVSLGIIMFLLRYPIAESFSDDAGVIDVTVKLFYFVVVYQVFDAAGVTTSGALRGAGDTRFPMIISFVCIWGVMLPLMFGLDKFFELGIYGAWAAASTCIIVCGIFYYIRFKRGKWKQMHIA